MKTNIISHGVLVILVIMLTNSLSAQIKQEVQIDLNKVAKINPALIYVLKERITIVNMVPANNSNETENDSEPNIAVNPENTQQIVASAFTPNPIITVLDTAPIYVSTDRGLTWSLKNKVPSGNGMTADIAVAFPERGSTLYTGILRGGSYLQMISLRDTSPFTEHGLMTTLVDNNPRQYDMPFTTALTSNATGSDVDHVYIGFNNLSATNSRTASVEKSNDSRAAAPPAGFTNIVVEPRNTSSQDRPPVRFAYHSSGVIYGVFEPTTSSNGNRRTVNLVVVRDDNFGIGTAPFTSLIDPSDNVAGRLVRSNIIVHFSGAVIPFLGSERGACFLSIAVDPNNAGKVWLAYSDSSNNRKIRLHVINSADSGRTWSGDKLVVDSTMATAITINSSGTVGVLYQRFFSNPNRWETHFQRSSNDGTTWNDLMLAKFAESEVQISCCPFLGDYLDVVAVRKNFYGVFSSGNKPDLSNFPHGVKYQRNADFNTKQLRNDLNNANISLNTIDPFFFRIDPALVSHVPRCSLKPDYCHLGVMDRGKIIIPCIKCVTSFPFDEICKYVLNCPGCEGTALCAPYYHLFIEDFNPQEWIAVIGTYDGEEIRQEYNLIKNGAVISFRPDKKHFKEAIIGDYTLYIYPISDALKSEIKQEFRIKLEASDYRFKQFMEQKK